jgi:dynein heavy chain
MFARRVAEASQLRDWVESMIRYNFLIDNMPTEGLPGLTSEQVRRITEYALNSKRLQVRRPSITFKP